MDKREAGASLEIGLACDQGDSAKFPLHAAQGSAKAAFVGRVGSTGRSGFLALVVFLQVVEYVTRVLRALGAGCEIVAAAHALVQDKSQGVGRHVEPHPPRPWAVLQQFLVGPQRRIEDPIDLCTFRAKRRIT